MALAGNRVQTHDLALRWIDLAPDLDQINAGAPQGVNKSPERRIVQLHCMQDRASRFYGFDLTEVLK